MALVEPTKPLKSRPEPAPWVLLSDAQGATTWVSEAFSAGTGYAPDEVLGRTPGSLLGAADGRASDGPGLRVLILKDGSSCHARVAVESRLDAAGRPQGHVTLITPLAAPAPTDSAVLQEALPHGDLLADAAARALLGLGSIDRLRLRELLDRVHPDDRFALLAARTRLLQGGAVAGEAEFRITPEGGDEHLLAVRWQVTRDTAGQARALQWVLRDRTRAAQRHAAVQDRLESQAIELELAQLLRPQFGADGSLQPTPPCLEPASDHEQQRLDRLLRWYRATQPDTTAGLFECDIDSGQTHADGGMQGLWGLEAGGAPSMAAWRARVLDADCAALDAAWARALAAPGPASHAFRIAGTDGAARWLRMDWVVGLTGAGRRVANGSVRDITAAVAAAQEAQLLHRELLLVADLARIGLMRIAAPVTPDSELVANAAARRILGLPAQDTLCLLDLLRRVHEADRPALARALGPDPAGAQRPVDLCARVPGSAGTETHVQVRCEHLLGVDGTRTGVVAALIDTTQATLSRQREIRLAESRALALEVACLGVWEVAAYGQPVLFDETLLRIHGWDGSARHLPLRRWLHALHRDDRRRMCQLWRAVRNGTLLRGQADYRIVRDDGSVRWLQVSYARRRDADGALAGVFGTTLDVSERVQAEQALHDAQARMRELAAHQQERFDELCGELARDLHDELGQTLGALAMEIDLLQTQAPDVKPRLRELLRHGVSCVRDVSRTLRPATLDLGLLPALRALAHDLSMRSDVDVLAELPSTLPDLPPATAQALFRIAQEALTNALRHAGAHRLTLRLLRTGVGLELQVEDDGCGFDIVQDNARRGLGLLGMRERASRAGAVLAVRSAAGLGTRVCAELALATTPKGPP